jgi:hypothetical protein
MDILVYIEISKNSNINLGGTKDSVVIAGNSLIQSIVNSVSPTTGALVVSGGVGVGGNLYVGGSFTVPNLDLSGNISAYSVKLTGGNLLSSQNFFNLTSVGGSQINIHLGVSTDTVNILGNTWIGNTVS